MFLETFCFENDKSNLIFNFNKKNTENDEGLSLSAIKDKHKNIFILKLKIKCQKKIISPILA